MDGWMDGWIDSWMDGWMDGLIYGWMDGWIDSWMDGWMDGWMGLSNIKPVSGLQCFTSPFSTCSAFLESQWSRVELVPRNG